VTDRIACAVIPALPLQMLLRRRPAWAGGPVAVVDRDRPTGRVLWASPAAVRGGVLPGMRCAAALALCRDLRAAEVEAREIDAEVAALAALLRRHSPAVEPSREEPGVFWLGARGLLPLFASLADWRDGLLGALRAERWVARAAVGFTRFGSFAAARTGNERGVFADPAEERAAALSVPLRLLGLAPDDRDALERLGVLRVRDLLALPAAGIDARFGPEASRLRRLAAGDLADPLEPVAGEEPIRVLEILEHAERDAGRLLRLVEGLLGPLRDRLAARRRAAAALTVRLGLDDGGSEVLLLRPAAPTRDAGLLGELVRLRLEATRLRAGVVEVALEVRAVPEEIGGGRLFAEGSGRDPAAAGRALARLAADLGPGTVVGARLRDAHLPEESFEWVPWEGPPPPPRPGGRPAVPALVRRILDRPLAVAPPGRLAGAGPFDLSVGWWGSEVRREYRYLEIDGGAVLWVFHDRRRWFLQGTVE